MPVTPIARQPIISVAALRLAATNSKAAICNGTTASNTRRAVRLSDSGSTATKPMAKPSCVHAGSRPSKLGGSAMAAPTSFNSG